MITRRFALLILYDEEDDLELRESAHRLMTRATASINSRDI
jgi:hypothetical protein